MGVDFAAWRFLLKYYRSSHRQLALMIALAVGQAFILLPIGLLIKYLFDQAIPNRDFRSLLIASAGILAAYLINEILTMWLRTGTERITKRVTEGLRVDLLEKTYTLSRSFYGRADLAKVHARFVMDSDRVDTLSNLLIAQLIPSLFTALVLSLALIWLNWLLALLLLSLAPILFILSRRTAGRVQTMNRAYRTSNENYSKGVWFVLQMLDLTRMQGAEKLEKTRQRTQIAELREQSSELRALEARFVALHKTAVAIANVTILVIGGAMVALGSMTLGALLSFYVVVALLKDYILQMLLMVTQLISGNEALKALYQFLKTEDPEPYQGNRQIVFRGNLAFEGVEFQYAEHPTLYDVSLSLDPPRRVALIGPNGAGKSTIIHLMLGFYRPQHGVVLADGIPYDELDISGLRRQIGIVPQDPLIFPGTITENIAYGNPDANAAQIQRAAEVATAHDFIRRLPQGYETLVGERGMLLSGGQRQRIAVARALLCNPVLLILDEPTNHLDEGSIHQLMLNLRMQPSIASIVIISHDLDVVREAEYVFVLEDGRIVASGYPAHVLSERKSVPHWFDAAQAGNA